MPMEATSAHPLRAFLLDFFLMTHKIMADGDEEDEGGDGLFVMAP